MALNYPTAFAEIAAWARHNGVARDEGRTRFAQYAVLRAITASRLLSRMLVFNGGNALDFVRQPNRSTRDLDFSADMSMLDTDWDTAQVGEILRAALEQGLAAASRELGIALAVQSLQQQPPGPEKTFITYQIKIGYALPDQPRPVQLLREGKPVAQVIPLDISLNEPICADRTIDLQGTFPLRVSTLEDIVAEKLRALLQQPIRDRTREQDLLDVAVIAREHPNLDHAHIAAYLLKKAAARDVPVSRQAFRDPRVAERARQDYAALEVTTRATFIPFDEALATLHAFIESLPIPEGDSS